MVRRILPVSLKERQVVPPAHQDEGPAALELHPLDPTDGLIIKVRPPKEPHELRKTSKEYHVPCDIVLVIDVSSSMSGQAPAPPSGSLGEEDLGFSILDLVQHAAQTIVEGLDDRDRLAIVTFSTEAEVLQEFLPMNKRNKGKAKNNISHMAPAGITNLWQGMISAIDLCATNPDGRAPAILVLTDGVPNHMCPPQGYIPKLRSMGQLPAPIYTFGFGNGLRSGLLKSIAEFTGGNYAFIPDPGMIGTVFVHALANLQSTFADRAVLKVTYPSHLGLHETAGETLGTQDVVRSNRNDGYDEAEMQLTIPLGSIQYGQSRDIYLRYEQTSELRGAMKLALAGEQQMLDTMVRVSLEYTRCTATIHVVSNTCSALEPTCSLDPAEIAYHRSRSAILSFLSTLYPLDSRDEHTPLPDLSSSRREDLRALITELPASDPAVATNPYNASLLEDLCGASPKGQLSLACDPRYFCTWGKHYLPSLAGAHARQVCNSFKDPGPLMYGAQSPLFIRCRDRLDSAFDRLPAPRRKKVSMSRYNDVGSSCFAGNSKVLLAGSRSSASGTSSSLLAEKSALGGIRRSIRIGKLRAGMLVQTPRGPRAVVAVLKTRIQKQAMCALNGGLIVTPWHPVSSSAEAWTFPARMARRTVRYTGSIYSVLLQRDEDIDAHAIMVNGVWGVTLGHGLVDMEASEDARAHPFFGDYEVVLQSLNQLGQSRNGLVVCGGIKRAAGTGLVAGFKKAKSSTPRMPNVSRGSSVLMRRKMFYA